MWIAPGCASWSCRRRSPPSASLLDDLAVQVKVSQKLVEENVIVPFELERIKAQHDSTPKKIQENERLLEQARAISQQAEQRRDAFAAQELPGPSEDAALEAIRKRSRCRKRS